MKRQMIRKQLVALCAPGLACVLSYVVGGGAQRALAQTNNANATQTAGATGQDAGPMTGNDAIQAALGGGRMGQPDPQMQAVLDELAALHPKPIPKLPATEARKQPTAADAVMALLIKRGQSILPQPVDTVRDINLPGSDRSAASIPVRVYKPQGNGPFPVLVYVHGGGWVIATIQDYDSSCRALANAANCIVVSVGYRYAPEHPFPAAHEDVYAVLQDVMHNAAMLGGDPQHVAIAGESAGGNMATAACMMARDRKGMMPVYQLLIYPVTNVAFGTPSQRENENAKPLNLPMLHWFYDHTLKHPGDSNNPYFSVLRGDTHGLPPATVIVDQIDPLRSEGAAYAQKLQQAGVAVRFAYFMGVTHEFFGMGAVVDKSKQAVDFAATGLKSAFTGTPAP